ncbi:MAG: acyltransferase [Chloroflexi bacterium]|nr:acyltransferase [Chloroflexota bacterium]
MTRMKYFINSGGVLYGTIYTTWRAFEYLKTQLATRFYRRVLASCGKRTIFQPSVTVLYPKRIEIGDDCFVGTGVTLFSESPLGKLRIANNTQVSYATIVDFTGELTIGERVLISGGVRIYTHDHGYDPRSVPDRQALVIENDVWIGVGAIILSNIQRIGRGAVIGAGAVVTKPVPERAIVAGNPARIVGFRDDLPVEAV